MNRFATISTTLLIGAAFVGCTDEYTYVGNAKLQPVKLIDKTHTAIKGDVAQAATKFVKSADELTSPGDDWTVRGTYAGTGTSHVRLDQVHDGVPVWGANVVVHTAGGAIDFVAGVQMANLAGFNTTPGLAKDHALAAAKGNYDAKVKVPRTQLEYSRESTQLVIFPQRGGETRLAWHVQFFTEVQGGIAAGMWHYFVDAETGDILDSYNGIHHAVPQASGPGGNAKVPRTWTNALDVKRVGGDYAMDTTRLQTFDMHNQTSNGTIVTGPLANIGDAPLNDAHGFAEITLNMLDEWQGFNSIDNEGFVIKSRVHYSSNYENAFWDGTQMTYGDGATTFYPLSGDVDVVAHEINHGFTSFHSDLIYSSQSGGLNESFSDIAGTVADFFLDGDAGDWDLGADVFKQPNQALRYMCDPTADGASIDNVADYSEGIDVHYSSGISNKAFCRASRRLASGDPTGAATQASVRRASQAWYRANAAFWTTGTTFQQGCQGVMDASRDLGFSEAEQDALRASWVDVGAYCDGEVEPLICDDTFTTDHGAVTSPNFPANYPDNFRRTYCIIPSSGSAATLHFTNFDTEQGYDFVVLKDATGAEVSSSSGTATPADLTSTTIVIKFNSDQIINRPGWRATW